MTTPERVMLLIDADNVSIDVMEQAVRLLLNQHGGVHVRRAYCTAESAVKHQAAFKRLAIKPMVNLAAGKNSTDIALAVDAIDLVMAERPDVVVIASSDSDFAPLVQRLREKGCVVRGIGQQGKTGDETRDVYDDFTVLEHRKSEPARKTPARKTAAKAPAKAESKTRSRTAARKATTPEPPAVPTESVEPAEPAPARKTAARKRSAVAAEAAAEPAKAAAPKTAARKTAARKTAAKASARSSGKAAAPSEASAPPPPADPRLDALLACLPELAQGQPLALNVAVQRLRAAQLLGKNSSSLKFFAQWGERVELLPPDKPSQVRLRA
jgi:uncharacterized protein (TIGR00288 family)